MMALFGSVMPKANWLKPAFNAAFYAVLPMCFFLVGSIMFRMHREIARLRHRVARLEHKQQADGQRASGASPGLLAAQRSASAAERMEDGG